MMSFCESLSTAIKLPQEIWTTILNFAFDPAEEYFYSSRKAIINVLSEVSHDFHQLIKKLSISTATKQLPHVDDDIACYCCANGYGSLLEHALMSGTRPTSQSNIIAARGGRLDCLKVLEEHRRRTNFTTLSDNTLYEASLHGHFDIVKFLMSIGMTPNRIAFGFAVRSGNVDLVKLMQSPDLEIEKMSNLAQNATVSGNLEMVKYIEQYLPLEPSNINVSAMIGNIEILQYYLDKGVTLTANLNVLAAENREWKYLKFALDHGAPMSAQLMASLAENNAVELMRELRSKGCPWDINAVRAAAKEGYLEALKFLIENGCPFTEPQNELSMHLITIFSGNNLATVIAARNNHVECLKYLIEIGAPMPDDIIDKCINVEVIKYLHDCGYSWGAATTVSAARHNNVALLKYLHENNCPWDERTTNTAAQDASIECLVYALDNGCPWDDSTINLAAVSGSLEALKICHEKGLAWNNNTCTILIQVGDFDMLKYAHENGAPWTNETINDGIDVMVRRSCFDCFKYAIDHGCPWDPQSTLEVALSYKSCHRDIAQWIIKNCNVNKPKDASA